MPSFAGRVTLHMPEFDEICLPCTIIHKYFIRTYMCPGYMYNQICYNYTFKFANTLLLNPKANHLRA